MSNGTNWVLHCDCLQKEKKDEQRRRGNPETQTSDARFDAQFRLANGLYGKQNMVRSPASMPNLEANLYSRHLIPGHASGFAGKQASKLFEGLNSAAQLFLHHTAAAEGQQEEENKHVGASPGLRASTSHQPGTKPEWAEHILSNLPNQSGSNQVQLVQRACACDAAYAGWPRAVGDLGWGMRCIC